ncbi:MAG: Vitamin K-dependent gamma-carboxylase, partial [Pseudomonadota bacterium]
WFIAIGVFFKPTRRWAMLSCLLLHLGILLTVRVSVLFAALMWGHLLLFVTDEQWRRLFRKGVPREAPESH